MAVAATATGSPGRTHTNCPNLFELKWGFLAYQIRPELPDRRRKVARGGLREARASRIRIDFLT